jgi:hypothetical protein
VGSREEERSTKTGVWNLGRSRTIDCSEPTQKRPLFGLHAISLSLHAIHIVLT